MDIKDYHGDEPEIEQNERDFLEAYEIFNDLNNDDNGGI